MDISLIYKGKTEAVTLETEAETDMLFEKARQIFSLHDQNLKILAKGKQVPAGVPILESPLAAGAKCMVMATGKREVIDVLAAKSDPTVKGFAAEDAAAKHHEQQQQKEELSVWGTPQDSKYKFCRFEACTWQSFGTRPQSSTPHGFEARNLMLKLAQDPAIVHIMREREYRVGLLAELDPVDDRLAEKMEGGGKRLLGYNTNAGAQIHIRLRTQDLSGFLPYMSLIDTLLHELCHNEVGPHNEHFWHLFCQLKADYLRALLRFSSRGDLYGGRSALSLADAAEEVKDVRSSVLAALERDRQMPAGPMHVTMVEGYLAASAAISAAEGRSNGKVLGSADGAAGPMMTDAERREMMAAKASARLGTASNAAASVALKVDSCDMQHVGAATASANGADGEPMDLSDALGEPDSEQEGA